jgi:methanol metabolism-related c-type cytochrome
LRFARYLHKIAKAECNNQLHEANSNWTIGSKEQGKRVKTFGIALIAATAVGCMVGMTTIASAEDAAAPAAAAPAAAEPAKPAAAEAPAFDPEAAKHAAEKRAAAAAAGGVKGGGKKGEDGKYLLPDGTMTYNIAEDGTVDWYTYSGYKRYHSECHVCHGPGGDGSTFAPALRESLKVLDYTKFVTVVMSGQQRDVAGTKYIMPALGDNPNVACFIDDLYAYIKARSDDVLPFGRPEKREEKSAAAKKFEDECFASLTPASKG